MKKENGSHRIGKILAPLLFCAIASVGTAQSTLTIEAGSSAGQVSPTLYGLMTEEINHSYDGGLYAELIRNRAFLDNTQAPVHWMIVPENSSATTLELDTNEIYNGKLSLRVAINAATHSSPTSIAND